MESEEFTRLRQFLGKSQSELARLLCVSPKTVQSFEQGWRKIPASAERQLLFLVFLKSRIDENTSPCWELQNCLVEWKENCAAWELGDGRFCWFINGTFCQGTRQQSWGQKIKLCRQCKVFQSLFPKI